MKDVEEKQSKGSASRFVWEMLDWTQRGYSLLFPHTPPSDAGPLIYFEMSA